MPSVDTSTIDAAQKAAEDAAAFMADKGTVCHNIILKMDDKELKEAWHEFCHASNLFLAATERADQTLQAAWHLLALDLSTERRL